MSRFATACIDGHRWRAGAGGAVATLVLALASWPAGTVHAQLAGAPAPAGAATAGATAVPPRLPDDGCTVGGLPLSVAVQDLQRAHAQAAQGQPRARAAAALGVALLRLDRAADALPWLAQAADGLEAPRERAAAALDLGTAHLARRQFAAADAAWRRAADSAPGDAEVALAVELNRLRLPALREAPDRLARLQAAAPRVLALAAPGPRARHALNLAARAREMPEAGPDLVARMVEAARRAAAEAGDDRLGAEAYDALADLYLQAGRPEEALRLAEQGLAQARHVDAHDLLLRLDTRIGQVARRLGRREVALQAYERAVRHIEAIRSDIPVRYQDGRSSFRDTLAPVYLGLTELLLQRAEGEQGERRQASLRQARDTVELTKQSELEDYLRDRCSVGAARRGDRAAPPTGTAVYYPIILPDRLELLVETAQGIERRSVDVGAERLRFSVQDLVAGLRAGRPVQQRIEGLYRWLIAPIDDLLATQHIHTLLAVPDGVLRLLPLAALHDGRQYLIERMAVATAPGLALTHRADAPSGDAAAGQPAGEGTHRRPGGPEPWPTLLAGISQPGPVVDKLSPRLVDVLVDPATLARSTAAGTAAGTGATLRADALRQALALPGVRQEIERIGALLPATTLLDQGFTLAALRQQLARGGHRIVHIASHGVFGDSADETFIMTYDELLTLDGLQALLRGGAGGGPGPARGEGRGRGAVAGTASPIELITLSACQTAEGDDRAPLGMSGTAIKARARSALGTLWPVADDAANALMTRFYQRLAEGGVGKAGALREAQIALLRQDAFRHPFHWAPFVLIGDWQ